MAAYSYIALDSAGKELKGLLEADSPRQIRQLLRDKGQTPLKVDAVNKRADNSDGAKEASVFGSGPSMKVAELALMTRQLATLIQAAMPLEEALAAIGKQSESAKVRGIVISVRSKVMEGHGLADSMAEFPRAFPGLYCATVAAGEHAGHLELVLNRLAEYSENSYAARQKAKLALMYPILLFFMAIAIVAGLMVFVVPDVVEVFSGQGQELPALTQALIVLSDFVVDFGLLLLLLIVGLVVAFRYALQNPSFRLQVDRRLLALPLIGRVARGSNTARYASTLSILTSSGVPLVDAMKIAAEVMANSWLKQSVAKATVQVREGGSLNRALEQCESFPPMMIHMIASGEMSGELDSMLGRVADHQQTELDNLISTAIGLFEPGMLLFMGGAVLVIVLAILQPIFGMNTLI